MSRPPTPAPTPTPILHEDLVLHALGRLAPRRREEVAAALARDPALAREGAAVARHLALYERWPTPPAPPAFEAVRARLGGQRARRGDPLRLFKLAAAALLLVAGGLALWHGSGAGGGPTGTAPGARANLRLVAGLEGPRDGWVEARADAPGELWVDERVRVVLDQGARLLQRDPLWLEGRAWFEVAPGPFAVATAHGTVEVLGTAFEVDTRQGLLVRVVEGRVRALGREAGPGETIATPDAVAAGLPGAFARRPRLEVAMAPAADGSGSFEVRLVFAAPQHLAVDLPGPSTGAAAAWLALTPPVGADLTVGLDLAGAGASAPQPGTTLRLAAGERRAVAFRVPRPPGPPGTWRLAALYRPEGEAALASASVPLEVR